ncbi:MAG: hypothetical protein R3F34_04845 [Planctomycetota bacterium]
MAEPRNAKEVFPRGARARRARREAFLFKACGRDDALLARVRSLLAAHERAERSMPTAIAAVPTTRPVDDSRRATPSVPTADSCARSGRAGSGRCGSPVRSVLPARDVALKVLKAGMDTREVVARFEAERCAGA